MLKLTYEDLGFLMHIFHASVVLAIYVTVFVFVIFDTWHGPCVLVMNDREPCKNGLTNQDTI